MLQGQITQGRIQIFHGIDGGTKVISKIQVLIEFQNLDTYLH